MDELSPERYSKWLSIARKAARSYFYDAELGHDLLHDSLQNLRRSGHEITDALGEGLVTTAIYNRAKDLYRYNKRRPTGALDEERVEGRVEVMERGEDTRQLRLEVRRLLDAMLRDFREEGQVDLWAVFLVRLRSTMGRISLTHEELEALGDEALRARFEEALPWHEEERARRIQRDWQILEEIWGCCEGVIRRDGLLRPGSLCEALAQLLASPPTKAQWTQWECRARREAGQAVLRRDSAALERLLELVERDARYKD